MNQFHFTLSSPDAVLFDGVSNSVTLATPNGEISILANHEPLLSLVDPGMMIIKHDKQEKILATGGGFVRISPKLVEVFAQTAEFVDSIDEKRAIEAKQQAESLMKQKTDEVSLADATALLERNIARLKTIERHKKRSHR